jgi:broad specificity phosphatase PhoE
MSRGRGHFHFRFSRFIVTAVVASLTAGLAGCGAGLTWYASRPSQDGDNDVADFKPDTDRYLIESAQRFGLMALLAEAVYRRDLDRAVRDDEGCAYLDAAAMGAAAPRYGLPEAGADRWVRWTPQPKAGVVPCLDDPSGLHYETYVHELSPGQYDEAVIAFRGTENRSGQIFHDWRSNFAAFFGFEPDQYAAARKRMVPLIDELERVLNAQGRPANIYAVGHSLGGGLAQQAGYMSKKIKEVYTYNTTPVTNWSQLRLDGDVKNAYPIFHRVYHGGEFLEKVRFVATTATEARYGRHDLGLQLASRTSFKGHSIQAMACTFAELIDLHGDQQATDHHYPKAYIRNTLLNKALANQPCSKAMESA